ncbi:uncharacterized protein LOC116814533 [Hylobates moloch]|uniref:uncharacterized protein LOC116814533 n=1 Tax=Hylobates moloch TaxID=81572 RepID=UPI0013F2383C|nr:uncharacterized protein LOC116814533 [Hylobates moloch]
MSVVILDAPPRPRSRRRTADVSFSPSPPSPALQRAQLGGAGGALCARERDGGKRKPGLRRRRGVWPGPTARPLRPGPAPRPQLRAAWSGAVPAGRDAVLRCEGPIPDVTFELLREGETKAVKTVRTPGAAANLELAFVGPQHAGGYRCRYRSWGPSTFESELSDPVRLLVAGDASLGPGCWFLLGLLAFAGAVRTSGPLPAPPLGTVVSAGSPQGSWGNCGRGTAQQRPCGWRRRWGSRPAADHALPSGGDVREVGLDFREEEGIGFPLLHRFSCPPLSRKLMQPRAQGAVGVLRNRHGQIRLNDQMGEDAQSIKGMEIQFL